MNKKIQNLIEQKIWVYLVPLFIFAIISLLTKQFYVAAVQAFLIWFFSYHFILHKKRKRFLSIMSRYVRYRSGQKFFASQLPSANGNWRSKTTLVWGNRNFYEINKRVSKRMPECRICPRIYRRLAQRMKINLTRSLR